MTRYEIALGRITPEKLCKDLVPAKQCEVIEVVPMEELKIRDTENYCNVHCERDPFDPTMLHVTYQVPVPLRHIQMNVTIKPLD